MRPELSHLAGCESKDIRTALWHSENPHTKKKPLACDKPVHLQIKSRKGNTVWCLPLPALEFVLRVEFTQEKP